MRDFWDDMGFRLRTNDNWRWLTLAVIAVVLTLTAVAFIPHILNQPAPETNYDQARRELYELAFGLRGERFPGSPSAISQAWGSFMHYVGVAMVGLAGIAIFATFVYFFPAFGDEVGRAFAAVRTKMWDKYGSELSAAGWVGRLAGQRPMITTGTQTQAGGQPVSRKFFLLGEFLLGFLVEMIGKAFGR